MGNHKSLTINITDPCTEAWSEMLPENDGRFCLSCQKKVIDFSVMSDHEILQTLKMAGKSACGRFATSQLDRLLTPPAQSSRPFLPTALLVTLLGTAVPEKGNAQQLTNITAAVTNAPVRHTPACIDGRIIDASTGEGIRGVTIAMKGSSIGCISDPTGYFRLIIPGLRHQEIPVFRISCMGYDGMEFTLDSSYTLPDTISLSKTVNNLREINVVSYTSYKKGMYTTGAISTICTETHLHRNWWQRLTGIFRKKGKAQ